MSLCGHLPKSHRDTNLNPNLNPNSNPNSLPTITPNYFNPPTYPKFNLLVLYAQESSLQLLQHILDTKTQKGDTQTLYRAILDLTIVVRTEKLRLARCIKVQRCRLKKTSKEEPAIVDVEIGAGLNRSTYWSDENDKRAGPHPNPEPSSNPDLNPNPHPHLNPTITLTLTLTLTSTLTSTVTLTSTLTT